MTEPERFHRIESVMERTQLPRTRIFQEFKTGRLRSVKVGNLRLVSESALTEFIARLEAESQEPPRATA